MPRKPPARSAADFFPPKITLSSLRSAAVDCKGCDLWKRGTQTVFGEGTRRSVVLFVGEQPGNEEDLTGKPFVGPAGRLFDKALEDAGLGRKQLTSPMSSNISNGSCGAKGAYTKNQTHSRLPRVGPGSKRKLPSSNQQ